MYIPPKPKSRFVTGLGIALIVVSAKIVLISFIYNFMINIMMLERTNEGYASAEMENVFFYVRAGLGIILLVGVAFLSSAIGLFYRKNWARILTIGLFFFVIAALFAGIAAEWIWMDNRTAFLAIKVISIVITGGLTFLLGWLIKKLNSEEIVKEFQEPTPDTFSL